MSRRNVIATFAAAAALAAPAGAFGATPQQIFADASDGHLDAHYSKSDLQRAMKDATVQGYGNQIIQITLNNTNNNANTNSNSATSNSSSSATAGGCCSTKPQVFTPPLRQHHFQAPSKHFTPAPSSSTLPFTGSNLATFSSLGVVLLAGGLLLRLMARRRQQF
jgi:hypothetical protein